MGFHEARLFPTSLESHDNLLLQSSIFSSGLLLSGYHPRIKSGEVCPSQQAQVLHVRSHHVTTKHTSSYSAASVNPASAGGGGGGLQGDCQHALRTPGSPTLPLKGERAGSWEGMWRRPRTLTTFPSKPPSSQNLNSVHPGTNQPRPSLLTALSIQYLQYCLQTFNPNS